MRVGIIAIMHESNTFKEKKTDFEFYQSCVFLRGEEIRQEYGKHHHEVSGFIQKLDQEQIEAVPLLMAWASPGGMVTADALERIWAIAVEEMEKAGPLDGFLVAPHGAGVSEQYPDMDGWWLAELRKRVGDSIPIVCTLDPHANVTEKMITACDATITYRENPHLDQKARGIEAAGIMVRALRGEARPTQAVALPPIAINIERQLTSAYPAKLLQDKADEIRALPGVLSVSVILGFPYADVEEMGSGFIVVTDNDAAAARDYVDALGQWLIAERERFRGELISVEEAIARIPSSPKPVGLLDMGDNIGGGATADSTILASALRKAGVGKSLVVLADPESVEEAYKAGEGNRVSLRMGGKTDARCGEPIEAEVQVVSLHDGSFRETEPRHGAKTVFNMGPTARVVTDDGLTVLLTTRRCGPASLQQLLSCHIDPAEYDAIVIKGVHAPVAAYCDCCPTLIRVNTPGITTADMLSLPFYNRRKPLFPFEEITG